MSEPKSGAIVSVIVVYERTPWQDRFNEPTPYQLRCGLPEMSAKLFDRMRSRLRDLDGIEEGVAWYGVCWRWAIEFRLDDDADPLAILIPSPDDLQFAMLLDPAFITSLPLRRMKRVVRDGLDLASEPFDTRWGVWSIQQDSVAEDLEDLAARRRRHLIEQGA